MPMRRTLSLRNRLALVFFTITLLSVAALYLYVAPGLQSRLMGEKLTSLAQSARAHSGPLRRTIGSSTPLPTVHRIITRTANLTGDRVTLISVNQAGGHPQLARVADSSNAATSGAVRLAIAKRAVVTRKVATGTASTPAGRMAEAAYPVVYGTRVAAVIVYSAPVSDVLRTVSTVRHEIVVAGALALLVALVVGYLVARALAQRVKRLELAAKQVAAGEFTTPIPVDSADELGQLAAAFNDMQSQLLQLEAARKKFIATASHELRTPVFSLGGFVELLEDEELDPETRRRFLDQVREQVQRLGKLSVDLLDLSRLESGSLELRPEEVDLGELTRSVSSEFEPTLAQHDARLELRLPTRIEAQCDPVRVAQIVRILIDNALTHTPPGTQIVVTAGRDDGRVLLAVRDDGEGIDTHALPRIFEPFYTADDAQGSGLGLAIASELADRMAGRLSVDSASGGTTFTLEIPA
ncbi:MAG TPA: HAMP domain-containing sensor histidine kinase [Solirubrobacteraceae bacterium]|jgi:signal transduction histidine kinase|nr:HAMP domain-containing sensor histidine kinase [Solirubrobacteraceae bacterium]